MWALTSGMNVATAHPVAAEQADHNAVLDGAAGRPPACFGIERATLQVAPTIKAVRTWPGRGEVEPKSPVWPLRYPPVALA